MAASTKIFSSQGTFQSHEYLILGAYGAVPGDYGIGVLLVPSPETGGFYSHEPFTGDMTLLGTFAGYKVYWWYVATEIYDWLGTGSAVSLITTGGTARFGYAVFHNPDGFLTPHTDPSDTMEAAEPTLPASVTVSADDSDSDQSVNLAIFLGTVSNGYWPHEVDTHGLAYGFKLSSGFSSAPSIFGYWSEDLGEPAQTVDFDQVASADNIPDSFRMFRISLRVNSKVPTPPGAPKLKLKKAQITELPYQVHTQLLGAQGWV
jgi:hypothetical protein